jgi:hypothetical protein
MPAPPASANCGEDPTEVVMAPAEPEPDFGR